MIQLPQLVIGLVACLALASALPGLFPRNNATTYKYYANVITGTIEQSPFGSQFAITGHMHVIPNSKLSNSYYMRLNVTHGIRNGEIQHFERIEANTRSLPEAAEVLNAPFIVIFNDNGTVKNVMISEDEAGWSRNMKKSIVSMLQLDLSSMNLETPMKAHGFQTKEDTIYGKCVVSYNVHRSSSDLEDRNFTVTKIMEPMSCEKFKQHVFNSKEFIPCMINDQDDMTTASRRVFHIENTGEDLFIKTLVAHGVINYFPWKAKSEAHYILANQSMEFDSMLPMEGMALPELDMEKMITLNEVSFIKSESHYAVNAGVDPTHGRHVVNLEDLIFDLINMLEEAVDYMNENNLEMTSPELNHGQTLNRILHAMTRMDVPSLENVFNNITEGTSARKLTISNLFLNMIPYVGTTATCLFTRNIIRKNKINDFMAITMLAKLPSNIRVPTDSLLIEMEDLKSLENGTSIDVRKAGILCFGHMIYKAYKNGGITDLKLVEEYKEEYLDHVKNEPTYEMKTVYLHGLRNIEVRGVERLVEPIIRGDEKYSETPDHLRLHAMLVNWGVLRDSEYIHSLYWPILSNTELPLVLRLCAYAILIEQGPRMDQLMNLYWFMVYEKNEHLYNFHYTAMKSLANTVDPCKMPMREMARKLLRFIRVRPVSDIMTGAWIADFINEKFGFGESTSLWTAADEHTGLPYVGVVELTSLNHRRPANEMVLFLRIEGVGELQNFIWNNTFGKAYIISEEIRNVLNKASEDMPRQKPLHIEISIMIQRRTVFFKHFSEMPDISDIVGLLTVMTDMKFNWQSIMFDELYTMQVPNDLGLPSLLHNIIPRMTLIQANNEITSQESPLHSIKLETIMKEWRHGYHSMEVYNPIIDTWHAIRRVSTYDTSLPIAMNIAYNRESTSLKLNLPRFPITHYSISGIRSYAKNYVMVMGGEDEVLNQYCGSNCLRTKQVTRGLEHRVNTTIKNYDSKDMGLHFGVYRYDCEREIPPKSRYETFAQMMNRNKKSTWDSIPILTAMILREQYLHMLINPELGTCGYIAKIEPSKIYPTSEVDINIGMSMEVPAAKVTSLLPPSKTNLRATLEARDAVSNASIQSWHMKAEISVSRGFANNHVQLQLMRTTPGKKDLKICIDDGRIYPRAEDDPLIRNSTLKQEVIEKLTITMGETDNGTCVRDVSVTMNTRMEMSNEQKEALDREMANGMCQKDIENPNYFYSETSIVPRTPACLRETMLRTSLRNYTYTVFYKNIPADMMSTLHEMIDDWRDSISGDITYLSGHTNPGIIKVFVEYPLTNEHMNLIIRTPTYEKKYTGIATSNYEGEKHILTNTRFSQSFVSGMVQKRMKFCVVYPEVLLNTDNGVIPFTVPSEWTLLTGDYIRHTFSVFVKRFESKKLGLLMTVNDHTITVIPSDTIPTVTVDDKVIDHVNGVTIPPGSLYAIRTIWSRNRLVIQSEFASFDLEWTERSVTLAMRTNLQGKVTGLCGHMDGTYATRMPKVYSFGQ